MATNKHDVEIRRIEARLQIRLRLANGFVRAISIAALALPIFALHGIIEPLAGKQTEVNADLALSIVLPASLIVNVMQWIKSRDRKQEVKRERKQLVDLEDQLNIPR